jgi:hypothetical protein
VSRSSYVLLNIILLTLICGIFIYCYFINDLDVHFTCIHKMYLGADCPSCGLSRSFSAILHHDKAKALAFNKFGWQIFLFFLLELFLRIGFLLSIIFRKSWKANLLKVDWIISGVLFLGCFYPFIISSFYLFYKMVTTGVFNI